MISINVTVTRYHHLVMGNKSQMIIFAITYD